MSAQRRQGSPNSGQTARLEQQLGSYRVFWIWLPVMLVPIGLILLLFEALVVWTALTIVVLLACPSAMGGAIYSGVSRIRTNELAALALWLKQGG